METVQDKFKLLMKELIAPKLRELGLKGSSQNFYLPSESHWALIGFQKSMFSDSQELKFTINIYVVNKSEWNSARSERSYFPAIPTPTTKWGIGWERRIGFLLPEKCDHWWAMKLNSNLERVSDEVIEYITKYALPAMREQLQSA
jgi:hypothetical protein